MRPSVPSGLAAAAAAAALLASSLPCLRADPSLAFLVGPPPHHLRRLPPPPRPSSRRGSAASRSTDRARPDLPPADGDGAPGVAPRARAADGGDDDERRDAEIRRYKDRAAVLELTLRGVASELGRANDRVAVLGDAARRMRGELDRRSEEMEAAGARLREMEDRSEDEGGRLGGLLAAAGERIRDLESRHADEVGRMRSSLDVAGADLAEAEARCDDLEREAEEREARWRSEIERARVDAEEEAGRRLRLDAGNRKKEMAAAKKGMLESERRLKLAEDKIVTLEEALRGAEEESAHLKELLKSREGELREVAREERLKRKRIKEELAAARSAQWRAESTAAEAAKNATASQKDRAERLEIAAAAARAAEEREAAAAAGLKRARYELRSALKENTCMETKVREALKERDELLERLETLKRREQGLMRELKRAGEDVPKLRAEAEALRAGRDGAQKVLVEERLQWAEKKKRYDRWMEEKSEGRERHLVALKRKLASRNGRRLDVDLGRGGSEGHATRSDGVATGHGEGQSSVTHAAGGARQMGEREGVPSFLQRSSSNASESNSTMVDVFGAYDTVEAAGLRRGGRFWKRIRSPLSWFRDQWSFS